MNFLEEIEKITQKYLVEAGLDYGHNKKGETQFTISNGTEDYIQHIITEYALAKKISQAAAQKEFKDNMVNMAEKMQKAPLLNGTMLTNLAETVAFDMMKEIKIPTVKFEKRVFQELFQEAKSEVPEFYPLSNAFEPKRVEPRLFYTPDKLTPEFDSIGTAACTPDAKLIFNVPFMEELMKFAVLKGIKASDTKLHGKKYESQGGKIPDAYLYCEFVLLHEIMHYGNGDFFFEKAYNLNGNIVNYVGDFISNYNLVKSGYAQLPIGLFNDEINYDRYASYQQMYDIIKDELDKLPKNEQQDIMDQLDQMGDEMPKNGEGSDPQKAPPQPGQGQPQPGQGQPQPGQGQPQDGEGSGEGEPQDGEGKGSGQSDSKDGEKKDGSGDGEGDESKDGDKKDGDKKDGKGSGSGDEKSDENESGTKEERKARAEAQKQAEKEGKTSGTAPANGGSEGKVPKSIDDAMKHNGETLSNAQDDTGRETKTGMNKDATKPGDIAAMMSGQQGGRGAIGADGNPYALAERTYKPKLNWKQLLKKMIPSGTNKDESYAKPSKRTTSSMVSVAQTGTGVVKPGTIDVENDKKGLCFILDNSGSTMDKIGEMQNDIIKLITKSAKELNGAMYVIKFSNDVHFFKVDVKKKKYGRITDEDAFLKGNTSDVKCDLPISQLFKSSYGGSTNLTSRITNIAKTLRHKMNYNIVLFSDTDIVHDRANAVELKQIFKLGERSVAVIATTHNDYKAYVDLLGDKKNITHL